MAYAGGEKGLFAPHGEGRGWELKVALVRAAIAGIDAIRVGLLRMPGSSTPTRSAVSPARRAGPSSPRRRATSTSASSSRPGTCSPAGSCPSSAASAIISISSASTIIGRTSGSGASALVRRQDPAACRGRSGAACRCGDLVRSVWERYRRRDHHHRDEPYRRQARSLARRGRGGGGGPAARGRAAARRLRLSDPRHARVARSGHLDADGPMGSGLPPRAVRRPPRLPADARCLARGARYSRRARGGIPPGRPAE